MILAALILFGCGDTIINPDVTSPLDGHWRGEILRLDNRIDTLEIWIDYSGPATWQGNAHHCIHFPTIRTCVEQYGYIKGEPNDFALDLHGAGAQGFAGRLDGDRIYLMWRGTVDVGWYHLERQ